MSLEQELSQIPKGLLAILVISGFVFFIYTVNPPHSICDTETENVRESLVGQLYPRKVKKNTIPPRLGNVMRACELGRSAGSCFEYFELLKLVAKQVDRATPDCRPVVMELSPIKKVIEDGIQNMALLAWGSKPPDSPNERFGFFQESELATFCFLREIYVKSFGESGWSEIRSRVFKKYPAGRGASDSFLEESDPKAFERMSESQLWQRSLFAIRCEAIR